MPFSDKLMFAWCSLGKALFVPPVPPARLLVRMAAEGARVLAGLISGDGPLSVRVRPSSLKGDLDRRTTSTGERTS